MSSPTNAMPLWLAESCALELQRLLAPVCERVAVAGSVRRKREVCNDVELVVIPKVEESAVPGKLIPEPVDRLQELMEIVGRGDHPILRRAQSLPGHRAQPWGRRYKKLLARHAKRWIVCELWITERARWGSIFAIRTGNAQFSKLLVTQRVFGGAMPANTRQHNGALESLTGVDPDFETPQYTPLYTPEEADFFRELGLPVLNPEERNETNLRRLLAQPAIQ